MEGEQLELEFKELVTMDDYQENAIDTRMYPQDMAIPYCTLGLTGEAGEVAEKVKKIIRDKGGVVSEEDKAELVKELGDVLWYITDMADQLGSSLREVAQTNYEKLASRKARKKLSGSGDNR